MLSFRLFVNPVSVTDAIRDSGQTDRRIVPPHMKFEDAQAAVESICTVSLVRLVLCHELKYVFVRYFTSKRM